MMTRRTLASTDKARRRAGRAPDTFGRRIKAACKGPPPLGKPCGEVHGTACKPQSDPWEHRTTSTSSDKNTASDSRFALQVAAHSLRPRPQSQTLSLAARERICAGSSVTAVENH